ncbi:extracellular matrix protein FRAS1-like, partial [Gouania willdenowi]|uniref:extracellular matrix protein FRAS1-like n=1 Tax=Gouania willdenowi TaxID=441366 RepID=UPI0010556E8A
NSHAPTLQVMGSLMVPVGGFYPLLPPLLQVEDQDSPPENLLLQLVQAPSNGQLVLFRQGEEQWRWGRGLAGHNLSSYSNFTWTEMKLGRVQFRHHSDKPRIGDFSVRAADPQLFSEPQKIQVQVVSFQAPKVLTLAPLLVENIGGSTTITKSVLNIEDQDNPSEVLILVFEEPQHGRLTRLHSERVVTQFKLEELIREQIQYVHDGSKRTQDRMVLQVNDGYNYQNVLLQVHISHNQMTFTPKTWVKEGGMVQLDRKYLKASYRGVDSDDIIYTLINPNGLPKHGELILMSMPADSPPEDWPPSLVTNRGFTPTTSFTQQDVNDGSVWYRHYGPGTSSDTFHFQASTDVEPIIQSESQTFTIGILPETPGFPQLSPHSDLQITALEDRVTEITSAALSFFDSETPDDKLIYNITKPLLSRQGSIEHRDRPYSPVKHFTQHDVNHGNIIYRPPQAPPHLQELYQYSFIGLPESLSVFFTVSDGEHTTPEMDFTVLLLSNHQQPPVFQVLDPVLEVRYGENASIGGSQLAVSDADTSPDELEFEVIESPVHGELMRTDSHTNTLITNGDTFTFSDITHNVLVYHHAGLSTQDDFITFTVSDGISMATTVVQVVVLGSENQGPQKDPKASLSMTVGEKSSSILRRSHLAYSDDTSHDDQIIIQLVSVPMYGTLSRSKEDLKDYSSFTMEDINQHRIRYITSIETGSQPITDIFHFVVHDGDKNHLDNQMFTITVTSTPRPLPVVTVKNGIKVHEGGRVQLSTNHIMVSDVETPRTDLLIWLVSPPKYGFIENTKKGVSFGSSKVVTPEEPFSVDDLTSGHMFYVQDRQREPNPQQDLFSLYISDGQRHTEAFTVEIDIQQSIEDKEPVVSVSIIHVEENSGVIITNSSLSIHDNDTPESEITFTITKVPTNGKLRRRQFQSQPLEKGRVLTLGHTFTYQDVIDQLIVYTLKLDLTPHKEDEVGFTITDGIYTHSAHLEFTMDPRRGEGPRITINRGLQLLSGSSSKITDQNLKATDTDSDSNRLLYFITKDPPVGQILLSQDGHVDKVSAHGPTHTFYQEDINKGHLQYSHDKGEKGGSVSLTFDVVDPEGNKLIHQSFFISVLEDHLPPTVVVNKGLVLDENSMKKLTTLQLSSTDKDSEPGELIYKIIKHTSLGHLEHSHSPGSIEHRDRPYSPVKHFTQHDVNHGNIIYRPPQAPPHLQELYQYSFIGLPESLSVFFTVSDGEHTTPEMDFTVLLLSNHQQPPVFQVLDPVLEVRYGENASIGGSQLAVSDADTLNCPQVESLYSSRWTLAELAPASGTTTGEARSFTPVLAPLHAPCRKAGALTSGSVDLAVALGTYGSVHTSVLPLGAHETRKLPSAQTHYHTIVHAYIPPIGSNADTHQSWWLHCGWWTFTAVCSSLAAPAAQGFCQSFLQDLIDKNKACDTVKVYLAAITICHVGFGDKSASQPPLICQFLKGARWLLPVSRPLVSPWGLTVVLEGPKPPPFKPLEEVGLKFASLKAVLLLALASAKSVSDIHALSVHPSCAQLFPGDARIILRPNLVFVPKVVGSCSPIDLLAFSTSQGEQQHECVMSSSCHLHLYGYDKEPQEERSAVRLLGQSP